MSLTITAVATTNGVTVTVTDFGQGYDFNTYTLYVNPNGATQQIRENVSFNSGTTQTFVWGDFTPNDISRPLGQTITVRLDNVDMEENSNTVTTEIGAPPNPIAFTLNSVTTTAVNITVTNFGDDGAMGRVGTSEDLYRIQLINDTDNYTFYIFNAPSNFFTLNDAKTIPFNNGQWKDLDNNNITPVANINDLTLVELINDSKPTIPPTLLQTTVTGGGGGGGGGDIPCFVAASNLLTPTGYKAAKDIKTGDLLMTADGRQVAVKSFSFTVEKANKESAPFFIPKNSISMGCPNADLRLSPWHAFQMKKGLWMKPMSALELGMPVQQYDLGKSVTYYHFEAPDFFKDNFVCEGTVVESFGGLQIKGMKGRPYTYNANLKGYTRAASKSVNKAIMM
jgi:hypothetical protein